MLLSGFVIPDVNLHGQQRQDSQIACCLLFCRGSEDGSTHVFNILYMFHIHINVRVVEGWGPKLAGMVNWNLCLHLSMLYVLLCSDFCMCVSKHLACYMCSHVNLLFHSALFSFYVLWSSLTAAAAELWFIYIIANMIGKPLEVLKKKRFHMVINTIVLIERTLDCII